MSTTAAARKQTRTTPLAGMLDQVARRVLLYVLRNVTGGEIEICDSGERVRLGREGELRAAVIVNDGAVFPGGRDRRQPWSPKFSARRLGLRSIDEFLPGLHSRP